MKRFSQQFNKKAASVKLRAAERRELRERLVSYMEYHPLPAEMKAPAKSTEKARELVSETYTAVKINFTYLKAALSTMAMLVIVVIPFMAENALPGDVLYPVKVQFNEEVRSSLSLSSYAKVEWETERLERRIAEARLLASEGKLTNEVEAEVAEAVKAHSDKAKQEIASIRETDEDEAAIAEIAFASALAVQSEVLEGDSEDETETSQAEGKSVAKLASIVAEASQEADASQEKSNPTYEKLLARIEMETTRAQELFISVSELASEDERKDIERRLKDIETKVNKAISIHNATNVTLAADGNVATAETEEATDVDRVSSAIDTSLSSTTTTTESTTDLVEQSETEAAPTITESADDSEARALLRSALSDTRKLISFMTNIDVRESVTIEELVPVTLTDDEHIALINGLLADIESGQSILKTRTVDVNQQEKFDLSVIRLNELVESAKADRAEANYRTSYETALEAALVLEELMNSSKASAESKTVPAVTQEVDATTTPEVEEPAVTEERATGTEEAI